MPSCSRRPKALSSGSGTPQRWSSSSTCTISTYEHQLTYAWLRIANYYYDVWWCPFIAYIHRLVWWLWYLSLLLNAILRYCGITVFWYCDIPIKIKLLSTLTCNVHFLKGRYFWKAMYSHNNVQHGRYERKEKGTTASISMPVLISVLYFECYLIPWTIDPF